MLTIQFLASLGESEALAAWGLLSHSGLAVLSLQSWLVSPGCCSPHLSNSVCEFAPIPLCQGQLHGRVACVAVVGLAY